MRLISAIALLGSMFTAVASGDTVNWPQFRGARSDGLAEGEKLPDQWSATENVVWKTDLPGWGWSSPVVWGDRIFVTSAVSEKDLPKPIIGGYPGGQVKPGDVHRWMVYCLDFNTGKILWEREAHKGVPPQARHPRNSYASETPISDGERVYAYFGNVGLFAYDMDGKPLWEQKWGSFRMRGGWGTGTSPVLHKDRICVVNDNEEKSFLVALDKDTGKQLWRAEREEKSNWSTPYIWENEKRTELVTIGTAKVRSYDLDGKVLWELAGTSGLVSLMPVAKHGLYASPWAYSGKLFLLNEDGTTYVIQDGPEFKLLGKCALEDNCWATPAIARGSLFIRTYSRLYRLQETKGGK